MQKNVPPFSRNPAHIDNGTIKMALTHFQLQLYTISLSQKKMINKMKHDLEQWREIILHVDAVLKWEKKFFPAIIFGVNSLLFLIVWYLDFSMLTMAALTVLFVAQMDYVFPFVSKILFKPNNWTGVQEKKFEDICSELCLLQCRLCSMYSYVFSAKEEKSTMVSKKMGKSYEPRP